MKNTTEKLTFTADELRAAATKFNNEAWTFLSNGQKSLIESFVNSLIRDAKEKK